MGDRVKACAPDYAGRQRVIEILLIDQRAARRVDEECGGLHHRQRILIDHIFGHRRVRRME